MIIGGSYIACETAATLAARGDREITMLMIERHPLMTSFGGVAGQWIRHVFARHRDPGRRRRQGRTSIEGHERVRYVRCTDG